MGALTQRPQLNKEQMWAHVLPARKDKLGLYNTMSRKLSCSANPPFARSERGRMDLELSRFGDVRRGGLERSEVGAVRELSLQITS